MGGRQSEHYHLLYLHMYCTEGHTNNLKNEDYLEEYTSSMYKC
jgi:hypothetical protein